ncbi:hypothetical protein [Candidatus Phytoplasma meliae]|uniref:Uncharacterized protein n=1 Tax=Candidatus Phytoplasma meliae TaxID=1848402 RepID=A0ABS5CY75_9MOLU|nr:hypothetical protein [Candidatus Phytoplasma meliae]MBP5835933.1 hypothetical protein [Candidatus Phytoplasma meliae]
MELKLTYQLNLLNNAPSFPYHNNIASTTIEFHAKPIKKINIFEVIKNSEYEINLDNDIKTCANKTEVENVLKKYNLVNERSKKYLSCKESDFVYNRNKYVYIKPTPFDGNPYYHPHGKILQVSPDYN